MSTPQLASESQDSQDVQNTQEVSSSAEAAKLTAGKQLIASQKDKAEDKDEEKDKSSENKGSEQEVTAESLNQSADAQKLLADPQIFTTQLEDAEKDEAKEALSLPGRYDILNSRTLSLPPPYGNVSPGEYYWGSLEISEDRQMRFFIDSMLQEELIPYFSKQEFPTISAEHFDIRGQLPESGDLSHLYFATPGKSGFLFSGSLLRGGGMTSLIPRYYQGRLTHVQFIKRNDIANDHAMAKFFE